MNFYLCRNSPSTNSRLLRKSNETFVAVVLILFTLMTCKGDQSLFEFDNPENLKRVLSTGANVTETSRPKPMLKVTTGHVESWPGITLRAPATLWDLSAFSHINIRLKNTSQTTLTIHCRVDNADADGTRNCVTSSFFTAPGEEGTLKVPLPRTSGERLENQLFGMRGYPVKSGGPGSVNPKSITQLLVFLNKPQTNHTFEIYDIRAEGTYTKPTAWTTDAEPFFPFIDTFGQYKHKDWPGKTHSLSELIANREAEAKELLSNPGPADWDKFGGWRNGPQLKATGFFRVEKHRGKWWLVDPDGRLFWSHGIDCVRGVDVTPIAGRECWFENFPGDQSEFQDFLSKGYALKGHYAGQSPKSFSFSSVNLARKYGPDWKTAYCDVIHRRLRSWGLNTIANWSDEATRLMRRTPYTDAISSRGAKNIEGSEGYWGKFPDVFDPTFADGLRRSMAAKKDQSANDPWCIGYFSDNEMSWGDELSLAIAALKSPPEQAARKAFLSDLQAKYVDVAKLKSKDRSPAWIHGRHERDTRHGQAWR